jgi:methylase of polypeptide subunit release factors
VMITEVCARVREAFLAAGYTADGLLGEIGAPAYAALSRGDHTPARLALLGRTDAVALLTRLFVTGQPVTAGEAVHALPLEDLTELGLVGPGRDGIRALLDVRPYGEPDTDWYAVSDLGPDSAGHRDFEVTADHVLGIGGASLTLAQLVPRDKVDRALDVGTGCGIQALHLARHSAQVTATDTNQRALRLAALTAGLSGQEWDLRAGPLFEPVRGEAYDLIVSNPPFVISPGHRYTYRDAGLPGDDLGRLLVQELPAQLRAGGTAILLANWLHIRGEDWRDRVAGWIEGTGCDAWIAQRDVQDPTEYVGLWLRDAGATGGPDHEQRYGEWLTAFDELGAEGIGFGWIVMRKSGADSPRVEDVRDATRLPRGEEVTGLLDTRAALRSCDAFGLLDARLRIAPGVELTEPRRAGDDGRLYPVPPVLRQPDGWRPTSGLDTVGAHVVAGCDGSHTLAELVDEAATTYDLDVDDVRAGGLLAVRPLIECGYLLLN